MPTENAPPPDIHSRDRRVGVLLVNLGTPDAADAPSVRAYLREFLTDPRVIENQGLVWKLVLHGIILRVRPARKARDYARIWNAERDESPLKTITRAQAEKLGRALAEAGVVVDWAMRYGNPSIAAGLAALAARGCDRVLAMPLYPQYSASTTATVCDEIFRVLSTMRAQPSLRVAPPYFDDEVYIDALAASIEKHLRDAGVRPEVILASFHGMPKSYIDKGDPYYDQCVVTVDRLRARLGPGAPDLRLTFQSRFGRQEWLRPYTDTTIVELARAGTRRLAVVTPGFAADCLETLEEIAVENADAFRQNGGETFVAIACLNDTEAGMAVLRHLARRELRGWVELEVAASAG